MCTRGGIGLVGARQSKDQHANLLELFSATLGEGDVQRDPVHPCLRRRVLLPALPCSEGAQECFLRCVLRGGSILEDHDQSRKDARIGRSVKLVEVLLVTRAVRDHRSSSTTAPAPGDSRSLCQSCVVLPVSYTHLRAHETRHDLVCRLLLEKK